MVLLESEPKYCSHPKHLLANVIWNIHYLGIQCPEQGTRIPKEALITLKLTALSAQFKFYYKYINFWNISLGNFLYFVLHFSNKKHQAYKQIWFSKCWVQYIVKSWDFLLLKLKCKTNILEISYDLQNIELDIPQEKEKTWSKLNNWRGTPTSLEYQKIILSA